MKISHLLILLCSMLPTSAVLAIEASLDSIVAIVDESVITERDLTNRINLIKLDFKRSNRRLPSESVMQRQVLEALITNSLLMQEAGRRGIRITDSQLNQTMQRMAQQSNMNLSGFRSSLIAEGLDYNQFRETVRGELITSTLSRQYGERNATISDAEVDEFIALSAGENTRFEYRLSHILIALPDAATPEQIEKAQSTASEILSRLDQGEQFEELANTFSSGDTALQGGDLGWRKKAEIPSLFTASISTMEPGDYAGPFRSASGLHIVSLKERRDLEKSVSKQTRTRHILIKPNELISEEDARNRLLEFRDRIEAGEDFARLARLYSVDYTSGVDGGDIGWMDPGATVREYENAANELEEGELGFPVRSQFGWHLIEVTGRRTIDETQQNRRNKIKSQLLEQKRNEVFELWKRRLRDEAYVIFPASQMPDIRIVITAGEPAGIGADIIAAIDPQHFDAQLVVIGDHDMLRARAEALGLNTAFVAHGDKPAAGTTIEVIDHPLSHPCTAGHLETANADYVLAILKKACLACLAGDFDAMVTAPVQKEIINRAGIAFSGHTEFLAEICAAQRPVMLLIADQLRVALITTHLPLRAVADAITERAICEVIEILDHDLRSRFGLSEPRIKVCGLNPHAGENGYLGSEEIEIIIPALLALKNRGIQVSGPFPADTLFTRSMLADADAVVAMYHDQGLPVLKHVGFHNAVNTTLGLPIIRSSVDHGTALDLAGTGAARPDSLFAAIDSAIFQARQIRLATP